MPIMLCLAFLIETIRLNEPPQEETMKLKILTAVFYSNLPIIIT
jgi:hypothetical protein